MLVPFNKQFGWIWRTDCSLRISCQGHLLALTSRTCIDVTSPSTKIKMGNTHNIGPFFARHQSTRLLAQNQTITAIAAPRTPATTTNTQPHRRTKRSVKGRFLRVESSKRYLVGIWGEPCVKFQHIHGATVVSRALWPSLFLCSLFPLPPSSLTCTLLCRLSTLHGQLNHELPRQRGGWRASVPFLLLRLFQAKVQPRSRQRLDSRCRQRRRRCSGRGTGVARSLQEGISRARRDARAWSVGVEG